MSGIRNMSRTRSGERRAETLSTGKVDQVSQLVSATMHPQTMDDGVVPYKVMDRSCAGGVVLSVRACGSKRYVGSVRISYDDGTFEFRRYTAVVHRSLKSLEIGELTDRVLL